MAYDAEKWIAAICGASACGRCGIEASAAKDCAKPTQEQGPMHKRGRLSAGRLSVVTVCRLESSQYEKISSYIYIHINIYKHIYIYINIYIYVVYQIYIPKIDLSKIII